MYNRKKPHIHFVGIGGIGMSSIATILHYQGYPITGCDLDVDQKTVKDLLALGCRIHEGNNTSLCHDATIDILVYSSALKPHNPEIIAAQSKGIPTISRAQMLAELMRTKYSIAIAGAHGKTTTTSMISHILIEAGEDPTIIIGGHLKNISSHARLGNGNFLVAEADESDKSFLRLNPTLAVVTNIDREHLDVYKDLDDIKNHFTQFLENLPFYGKAFLCADDIPTQEILPIPHVKTILFGTKENADIQARDLIIGSTYSLCSIWEKNNNEPLGSLYLTMPGYHNILNATAATTVALELGIPFHTISKSLATFKGIDRRFTFRGSYKGAEIFDDYGHHPTEIFHTLTVAKKRCKGKLIVAFQPHRYTRTKALWKEFIEVFSHQKIDHLVVTDIHAASEQVIDTVHSTIFVQELQQNNPQLSIFYTPFSDDFLAIKNKLDSIIEPNDLVILLGAGKINKIIDKLFV